MGKGRAIASLVCGILSILVFPLGLFFGLVALVLGISVARRTEDGKGMAIAGIVTGSVGICVGLIFILIVLVSIGEDANRQANLQAAQNTLERVCGSAQQACLQKCESQWFGKDSCKVACYDEHTRCMNS